MKLFAISFIAALFLLLPVFIPLDVFADGQLYGRVFMNYQGRQIPLKGVFINKVVDCNKLDDKNQCQDKSCLGSSFCPSIPQPYYTKDDGSYSISGDDSTLIKNGQPAVCKDGGFEIACGINCGNGSHEFSAYFPSNYNINNFPGGIDLRKGHFKAATPQNLLTDAAGNQYYHLAKTNNGSNNPDLDFEWIPDPLPIAGMIIDSQTGKGISGVNIEVVNDRPVQTRLTTTTNSEGKFSVDSKDLLKDTSRYAVRIISATADYQFDSRVVTTTQWSWINALSGRNASPPDQSYELQDINNSGCAGPDNDPSKFPHQTGRCNFKLDPKPVITDTSTPGTPGTPGIPGSAGTGTSNPNPLNPASSLPPGVTDPNIARCINLPASGDITGISVDNKSLALSNATSLALTLKGFAGQSNFIIPVVIKYSNEACRVYNLGFKYVIPSSSRPSPNPADCAKSTGRPDDCACIQNNQCQGGKCDPNRGNICSTLPFIQTQGGDVHSNVKIQQ